MEESLRGFAFRRKFSGKGRVIQFGSAAMSTNKLIAAVAFGLFSLGFTFGASSQPFNQPPPAGAILDLDGLPITNQNQGYNVSFVATNTSTAITFAFRQDPGFMDLFNVQVADQTTLGPNLILNGNFTAGSGSNAD